MEEHDLSNLISVKGIPSRLSAQSALISALVVIEVPHESALPGHPAQHWKYTVATFAISSESSQSQTPEGEQLFLNLPDNACWVLYCFHAEQVLISRPQVTTTCFEYCFG